MVAMVNGLTYARKTTSPEATKQLAATLAPYLRAGDVIVLNGGLGAGKTQFVKGVALGLGIQDTVTSPTFNILLCYEGENGLPLYHFDLYRLDDVGQLEDVGYYEILDGPGATFIEWGEKFPTALPFDYLEIAFETDEDQMCTMTAHAFGERSRRLLFLWAQDSRSRLVKK